MIDKNCNVWDYKLNVCTECVSGYTFTGGYCQQDKTSGPTDPYCNEWDYTLNKCKKCSFRYFFNPRSAVHPFLGVEGGAALFGDTFQVATGGWYVDGRAGVEIEATDTLSFTIYAIARALYTVPFTSPRDDVRRSSSGGLDLTLSVGGGLALRFGP